MSSALEFTLGLNAQNFLSGLGLSSAHILSFAGAMEALKKVGASTWSAIERGGKLLDLSNRTGETVGTLYQLQAAFEQVGLGADSVQGLIGRLQKSMGGVTETGQKTSDILSQIGINLESFKKMSAADQIGAVAEKLGKFGQSDALDVGGKLFGRENAGAILQISRDMEGFQDTLKDAAEEAAQMQRNAAAFDDIGDKLGRLKRRAESFWVGLAEAATPALQAAMDFANAFDFNKLGQQVGTVLTGLAQALREGKLMEVVAVSVRTGFNIAIDTLPASFAKLGTILLRVFETPLTYIQAWLDMTIQGFMQMIGRIPGVGEALGWNDLQVEDVEFSKTLEERKKGGISFGLGSGQTLDEMDALANTQFADALRNGKSSLDDLWKVIENFASRAEQPLPAPGDRRGGENGLDLSKDKSGKSASVSDWERIGLVMGGGRSAGDYARETATHTASMASTLTWLKEHANDAYTGPKRSFALNS